MGLINSAVPAAELDAKVHEIAAAIAAKLPDAIALGKDMFRKQRAMNVEDAYAHASARMVENMGWRETQQKIDVFLKRH